MEPGTNQSGLDSEGRLIDQSIADAIIRAVQGQPGRIAEYKQEPKQQAHPKAFSLADITLVASNRWGYSADQTLKIC